MMMGARKNGHTDRVDIFLKCCFNNLLWSTPEAGINHLHPRITQSACDDKRPPGSCPSKPGLAMSTRSGREAAWLATGDWRPAFAFGFGGSAEALRGG